MESNGPTLNDITLRVASGYLTGASLTLILWDHLLTLDREVQLIWKSTGKSSNLLKGAFAFNRYGVEAILLLSVFCTGGIQAVSENVCRGFIIFVVFCGAIASAISQFVFLLRVYTVTEQQRSILRALVSGFIVMIVGSQVFAVLTALRLTDAGFIIFTSPRGGLNVCIGKEKPLAAAGLFAFLLSFDIFLLFLTIYNAMHRPRRTNTELIKRLEEDGAKYFFALLAIQSIYLIMSVAGSSANVLLFLFIFWSLGSIIMSRLHFRMEELSIENSRNVIDMSARGTRRRSIYNNYDY